MGRTWVEARLPSEVEAAGRWRSPRAFDARGHDGLLRRGRRRRRGRWSRSPPTTTSGWRRTPTVVAAAHEALDRWGAGAGRVAPGDRLPARAPRPGGGAGRVEGDRGGGGVPHRVRRQPVGAVGVRRRRCRRPLRRAQPRLDHRRLPAGPGGRAHRTPTATSTPSTRSLASVAGRSMVVSDTVFSMDGDAADLGGPGRRGAGATVPCSCSTRPTPCSGPTWSVDTTEPTCCGWGRCPRRSVRWAASWPVRPASSSCWSTGPAPTSSPPPRPRPTPPRRWPPSASSARPRVTALRDRLHRHVGRVARADRGSPGHPSPIVPVVVGARGRRGGGVGRPPRSGAVGAGHPSAHRATGHVPPARHPVGHPHRRAGRPTGGRPGRGVSGRGHRWARTGSGRGVGSAA